MYGAGGGGWGGGSLTFSIADMGRIIKYVFKLFLCMPTRSVVCRGAGPKLHADIFSRHAHDIRV